MKKFFKLSILSIFTFSLTIFIWGIINIFFLEKLPTYYINIQKETNFYNIHLENIFLKTYHKPKIETLNNIKLKAIFENQNQSFVIIYDKKEIFLDLNQSYKGYKLIKVLNNSAIFEKNNKQFKIDLNKPKQYQTPTISKKLIKQFIQNPDRLLENISIRNVSNGYKITFIKKGSIFDKLELQKGDIILEINNIKVTKNIWEIYNQIENIKTLHIKIKRDNQIKELNYEIS